MEEKEMTSLLEFNHLTYNFVNVYKCDYCSKSSLI